MSTIPPRWKHQEEAFQFVRRLWDKRLNGAMLAMAMGTGKSRVATELAVSEAVQQLLIVSPLQVVEVWRQQLERFAPGHFHFLALDDRAGTVEQKLRAARLHYQWSLERHQPVAIGINYDSARLHPFATWAVTRPWDMSILDELHRIKEPRGRTSMWAAKLGLMSFRRLGLTGTPMPHEPTDIWGQFRYVNPFHLERSFGEFRARYAVMGGYFDKQIIDWQNLDELQQRFAELAFRVDDSVLDLPPEMDETRTIDMSPEGQRIYHEMEREMLAWVAEGVNVTAANAMVRLLRLQQITGGTVPDEAEKWHVVDHAKEDLLEELLTDVGEPVAVFCRFKPDLLAVHRAAQRAGLGSGELSGERDDLARWQGRPEPGLGRVLIHHEGEATSLQPDVLAVQIQSGSEGIDLTRARIAIYYSHGFSLKDYLQSRARIRRPPQQRPCLFFHLQVRNSVDEYVLRSVLARRDLVDSVLEEIRTKGATHVVTG